MADAPIHIDARAQARFTAKDRLEIMQRQSDAEGVVHCATCDTPIAKLTERRWENIKRFDFDHDRARSMGGATDPNNGRALCAGPGSCHSRKSRTDRAALAWSQKRSGETLSQRKRRERDGPSLKGGNSFRRWT